MNVIPNPVFKKDHDGATPIPYPLLLDLVKSLKLGDPTGFESAGELEELLFSVLGRNLFDWERLLCSERFGKQHELGKRVMIKNDSLTYRCFRVLGRFYPSEPNY